MKKFLCIACLTALISVNAVPATARSTKNIFAREVVKGILINIGSEAAQELLRAMFSSSPEERRDAFTDGEYLVSIDQDEGDFIYYGVNLETQDSITLRSATLESSRERQVYSWSNVGYRYQVAWRPNDPEVIRLQVFSDTTE